MTTLSTSSLADLPAGVPVPTYDRSQVRTGIVHLGVGGFHRSHLAAYVDELLERGGADEWGITGVGVLEHDRAMRDALVPQDCLYTLVLKHADGSLQPRVIGSVVDYLLAPDDPGAVLERMAAPTTRIVSLTVTEGGYPVEPDPDRDGPLSAFGLLVEALARRRAAGTAAFTVMSCDNIPGNGAIARRALLAEARRHEDEHPGLAGWIEEHVSFPSSMVDRITPVTTDEDRARLAELGVDDRWPVVSETFRQWVLEDDLGVGRPPFEDVGVQLVEDVEPYELMKLRLLNAGHQAICFLGYLAGHRYAHEVAGDPLFADLLLGYLEHEATPTLAPVPGIDLDDYRHQLVERFANPAVRDTLARLCAETSDRIPTFLLPVVRDQLARDGDVRRSALVVAAWARYAEGTDEQGEPIEVVDRLRDQLVERARRQHDEPLAFLTDRALFGDLVDDERFAAAYTWALTSLHEHGARATVEALLRDRT